jgi:hypothetical protein
LAAVPPEPWIRRARAHLEIVELRAIRVRPEPLLPPSRDDRDIRKFIDGRLRRHERWSHEQRAESEHRDDGSHAILFDLPHEWLPDVGRSIQEKSGRRRSHGAMRAADGAHRRWAPFTTACDIASMRRGRGEDCFVVGVSAPQQ